MILKIIPSEEIDSTKYNPVEENTVKPLIKSEIKNR